ncbi:MAG: penicillin-binding protein activator [Alphaproteobacteria bacterium]|nr:penicillin-binding protein activator [Alphaproteobacteria bacterium]
MAPIPKAIPKEKIKAAILLPLTGPHAALGRAMLNAAEQAVFDVADANFELQSYDTAAVGGAQAAAQAVIDGGPQLIIGPLFASDVPSVKLVAQIHGLSMMPLSTDTTLADQGVYVMGLAPEPQVERVVAFAAAHGLRKFAALVPATPYGALVGEVFRRAVAQNGGQLVAFEIFEPQTLEAKVQKLAVQKDSIDALFLPESGPSLSVLVNALSTAGISPSRTRVLGTGIWDVPGLGRSQPFLIGAWYAAPDSMLRRNFITRYVASYNREPPRLATLAYDATALAAILAKQGSRYDEPSLTNPNGFAGLDGIFRLKPSGKVERAMAINELAQDGVRVIDPAPTTFVLSPFRENLGPSGR